MNRMEYAQARRGWLIDAARASAPVSVRNLYYQAVSGGVVPKTEQAYKMVANDLAVLRRDGALPIEWITDGSRAAVGSTGRDHDWSLDYLIAAHIRGAVHDPGISPWAETGIRPVLAVESRSIAGMLAATAEEWEISIWPMAGQPSISFTADLAAERPDRIGYVGDYDASGVVIRGALRDQLSGDHGWHEGIDYTYDDLAVTVTQIVEMDLPARPGKHTTHSVSTGVEVAVEAEAIPANTLRQIVSDWAASLQPEGWVERWTARRDEAEAAVRAWAAEHGVNL